MPCVASLKCTKVAGKYVYECANDPDVYSYNSLEVSKIVCFFRIHFSTMPTNVKCQNVEWDSFVVLDDDLEWTFDYDMRTYTKCEIPRWAQYFSQIKKHYIFYECIAAIITNRIHTKTCAHISITVRICMPGYNELPKRFIQSN